MGRNAAPQHIYRIGTGMCIRYIYILYIISVEYVTTRQTRWHPPSVSYYYLPWSRDTALSFFPVIPSARGGGDIHRMVRRFIQDAPDTKPNHIATPNQTILPHQTLEGPQGSLCNTTHITGTNCKYHQWYSGCLLCLNDTPQPFSSRMNPWM